MKPAPRRWVLPEGAPLEGYEPVLGALLTTRGFDAEEAARLTGGTRLFHDPFGLRGLPEAVVEIGVAVTEGRRIAVYGDYDADGVTACAMLTTVLRAAGADVVPYIPNRMAEGYGLHAAALEDLAARGVALVVSVDCGTSGVDVAAARPPGMRLVITDHHLAPAPDGTVRLPVVEALVNPKVPGETYAFDALAGAGVAWKLVAALEAEGIVPSGSTEATVALAALGTVADMMPLRGENRAIVGWGLEQLCVAPSPGLRALARVSGVGAPARAADLAFGMAPRINAAGRMEDAELALRLCLAETDAEAEELAARLQAQNEARKAAVTRALAEAEARVADLPDNTACIVLGDAGWPMGIVGLVAGRLADRYGVPTFVACLDPVEARGSARTARGVHLVRALDGAAPALARYGGHAVAAGFSLDASRFDEFAALVTAAVTAQCEDVERETVYRIDAEITLEDCTPELAHRLAVLEPCGQGNREPLLVLRGAKVLRASTFGRENNHLRVVLGDAEGGPATAECIAFFKGATAQHLPRGRLVDVIAGVELDTWDGSERLRLRLRDIRPCRSVPAAVAVREEAAAAV